MEDTVDVTIEDSSRPTLENMVNSPIVEQAPSKYKLKLRYKGFFELVKSSSKIRYCFGSQKCIYMDASSYNLNQLNEEVLKHYQSKSDLDLSIIFLDKHATEQSFIELNSDENFMVMLSMYEKEKEITIFVTTEKNLGKKFNTTKVKTFSLCTSFPLYTHVINHVKFWYSGEVKLIEEPHDDGDSDYCPSDESYYSHISSDNDDNDDYNQLTLNCDEETSLHSKKSPLMKINMKFPNVTDFRRAMNHYAVTNEFDYFIEKSDLTRFTAKREKIMKRFDKKRRIVKKWNGTLVPMAKNHINNISKNLGEYKVSRSNDNKAEVEFKGNRWEVILDERKCTCRVWQVKGIPCVHAAAFIAFTRDTNWEKYVDTFFTIEKFKEAYALEVAPIPRKNEWAHIIR